MILFLIAIFLTVPATIWRGFVGSLLWGWFLVPMGLPPIGVALAIGFCAVTSLFMPSYAPPEGNDPDLQVANMFIRSLIYPAMALAIGWVALQYTTFPG